MSVMGQLHADLETIRSITEPVLSAEDQMERKLDWIIRELDELCAMAANRETIDLVEGQRVAVGQMKTRVDLICSFLMARQPRPTMVHSR